MARERLHWAILWWHADWDKMLQVIILICSEQASPEFFCCRHPLIFTWQGHPHQYLRWVSIEFQADHGKGGSTLGHAMMACQLRKNMASPHYDLQWTNIVWILMLSPFSCPHNAGPSSVISKVSLHWISDQSWQGGERIEPCQDGMPIKIKYGKPSLWSAVNEHCLNSSVAATLLSSHDRALLTNI